MIQSVIQPKQPKVLGANSNGWIKVKHNLISAYPIKAFKNINHGLYVLSAVEVAEEIGQPKLGAEYHISISKNGQRCTSAEAAFVLHHFDLEDGKEDNHVPNGVVRNFWRPVADHLSGYECSCVNEEPAIKEDKGDFIWRGVTK